TVTDANATVTVNNTTVTSGTASGSINLSVGTNTITTVVTAEDGSTTKTYTVVVTRAAPASTDATLSALSLSSGTLSPSFAAGTVSYTASVPNTTTSITVTPTVNQANATVTVNNTTVTSGTASGSISLSVGTNTITTVVTAEDGSTTKTYTVVVIRAVAPTFAISPGAGPLPEAMAGEDYHQEISVSGGVTPLLFSLSAGSLPDGMVLNVSTGALTGPLDNDTEGDYSFTVAVEDGNGDTTTVAYTLKVVARAVTVSDKVVTVAPGTTPADVYLNSGATGGPFTAADLTFVEPANAGTATIIQGQVAQAGPVTPVGWYLQFTPNFSYSGQVRVGFRLTSALGVSNTGTVTYNLGYDPDSVVQDIDGLVRGFVRSRQSLIASTLNVPGLLERRRMATATDPITMRMSPSPDGMTLGFSTSLAQIEAARDHADGVASGDLRPFNLWIDGAVMAHNRDDNGDKWGQFAMISVGADYLLSEKALIGLSFHYDHMTDPSDEDAELTGNGWLAGPYASLELGHGVYFDTSVLYGGSSNDIDTAFWDGKFDTRRFVFDTALKGQWELDNDVILSPKARLLYLSEKVETYSVSNDLGDEIGLDGFTTEQLRASLGAEISRNFTLDSGAQMTPVLGASVGFSGLDGAGAFGTVSAGMSLETASKMSVNARLLFTIEGDGDVGFGLRVGAASRF
ncbi:cadherin-like beta sandwich domain-containing protein, partial [Rhizobium sp. SGZ-381]|uniref:cadherin-like beta sandwich domain-containing protein n=1 Tax=Rhizobium sp. SGZ-381 TaxID=3342800 RepID=UPI00366E312A